MPRIIQSIHLSEYQARVMLVVQQAESPELAFVELGNQDPRIEQNLLGARDALSKIGLIEMTDSSLTVTEQGEQVMRDEFLIDESGQPTEKGNEILQRNTDEKPPEEQGPADTPPEDMGAGGGAMAPPSTGGEMETSQGDGFPAEGSIFRHIHDLSKLKG